MSEHMLYSSCWCHGNVQTACTDLVCCGRHEYVPVSVFIYLQQCGTFPSDGRIAGEAGENYHGYCHYMSVIG